MDHIDITLVLCTMPDSQSANTLAKNILFNKLAACVSIISNILSIYSWKDKLEEKKEAQLLIKSNYRTHKSLVTYIKNKHPYDTPELLTIYASSEEKYLSWLNKTLS